MGVKDAVMKMARTSENKEVRERAMVTLQKLLVEGWSLI